jgi:hypothetical protein
MSIDSVSTRNVESDTQMALLAKQMQQEKEYASKVLDMSKPTVQAQSPKDLHTNRGSEGRLDTYA